MRRHSAECERYRKAYAERYPDARVTKSGRVAARVCNGTCTH